MDVTLVLSTSAHCTAGAEHQDGKFRCNDTIYDTWELLWFIFALQLDGYIL